MLLEMKLRVQTELFCYRQSAAYKFSLSVGLKKKKNFLRAFRKEPSFLSWF